MDGNYCTTECRGRVTIITINRPNAMNALHPPACFELEEAFNTFDANPEQWVAILVGAGEKAFSAGNDLKFAAAQAARGEIPIYPQTGFGGLTSRFNLSKPLIAAVNGVAMGGGFEMALACDIIVAAEHAVFALPEPRVGMAALAGGLHRLPREIGLKRAMHMILTGRRVTAQEGKELGFVNEVVPAADLMAVALAVAAEIVECSPMSIRASKEAIRLGEQEPSLASAVKNQRGYPAMAALLRSADFKEGPCAFAERRPPRWTLE